LQVMPLPHGGIAGNPAELKRGIHHGNS